MNDTKNSPTGYQEALLALKVGDTVGIKGGGGVQKKVYRLEKVSKVTKAQIVTDDRHRFWKKDGKEVNGLGYVEIMTDREIKRWRNAKEEEERKRELRQANYNPADHDDHVQAALRSIRDKARTLGEKLQFECELRASTGKERPDWFPQFMMLVAEIDDSENALKSIGLSTTLKSFEGVSSIFK